MNMMAMILVLVPVTCLAQGFTGDGDGSSWHDPNNWFTDSVPGVGDTAGIGAHGPRFHVNINSAVSVRGLNMAGCGDGSPACDAGFPTEIFDPVLNVNAPLLVSRASTIRNATINFNSDSTFLEPELPASGGLSLSLGATVNLNSGTLAADTLSINNFDDSSDPVSLNQIGGNLIAGIISIEDFHRTTGPNLTIGTNDNITGGLFLFDGASVILNRQVSLAVTPVVGVSGFAQAAHDSTLTINDGLFAEIDISVVESTLNLNGGVLESPMLGLVQATVNRSGGQLNLLDLTLINQEDPVNPTTLTIEPNDILTGRVSLSGNVHLTLQRPVSLQFLGLGGNAGGRLEFAQDDGESTGISIGSNGFALFFNSSGTIALEFDNENTNGLDWTFRVAGNDQFDIQNMLDDGRITAVGGTQPVSVIYDPVEYGDYTYVGYVDTGKILLGDVNCDGVVNLLDVQPFVTLISTGGFSAKADFDGNGIVNLLDVQPFVEALTGS